MLDGFLCAVLSGPRLVLPSAWMPWVCDHEAAVQAPEFRNDKDAERVINLVPRFAGLLDVEIRGLGKIAFGARVNRVGHPRRARRRSII